jgi:hypothetical protein
MMTVKLSEQTPHSNPATRDVIASETKQSRVFQ